MGPFGAHAVSVRVSGVTGGVWRQSAGGQTAPDRSILLKCFEGGKRESERGRNPRIETPMRRPRPPDSVHLRGAKRAPGTFSRRDKRVDFGSPFDTMEIVRYGGKGEGDGVWRSPRAGLSQKGSRGFRMREVFSRAQRETQRLCGRSYGGETGIRRRVNGGQGTPCCAGWRGFAPVFRARRHTRYRRQVALEYLGWDGRITRLPDHTPRRT